MKMKNWVLALFTSLISFTGSLSLATCDVGGQNHKLALLVFVTEYAFIGDLKPVMPQQAALKAELSEQGFQVISRINPARTEFVRSLECFQNHLANVDKAVFYFFGHALQVRQSNYFLAADFFLDEATDNVRQQITQNGISLDRFRKSLQLDSGGHAFIIIDSAKTNPFSLVARNLDSGSQFKQAGLLAEKGLAKVVGLPGQTIVYANWPGSLSHHEYGEDLLLSAYLKNSSKMGFNSMQRLKAIRDDVYQASSQTQKLWDMVAQSLKQNLGATKNNAQKPDFLDAVNLDYEKNLNRGKKFLYDKGRPEKAISFLKKAIYYGGNSQPEVYFHLGTALFRLKNYAEAITQLKKIENTSYKKKVRSLLARAYNQLGDQANANRYATREE